MPDASRGGRRAAESRSVGVPASLASDPLYAVAYASRPARAYTEEDLADLLRAARDFNARHGVTGRLVVVEHVGAVTRFYQWFEGPIRGVVAVLGRIVRDSGHREIGIINQGRIPSRRYEGWDMAFDEVDDDAFAAEVRAGFAARTRPTGALAEEVARAVGAPGWRATSA